MRKVLVIMIMVLGFVVQGWGQEIGEEKTVTAISHLRANASWNGCSRESDRQQAIYNPPSGWVIVEYNTIVHSRNNGSSSVSVIAQDLNFVFLEEWNKTFDGLMDLATKYNNDDAKFKIKQKQLEFSKYYNSIESNKNTIRAQVEAKAHGSCLDKKRGWCEISVTARLVYVGIKEDIELQVLKLKNDFSLE